jgi:hypothetical protein
MAQVVIALLHGVVGVNPAFLYNQASKLVRRVFSCNV